MAKEAACEGRAVQGADPKSERWVLEGWDQPLGGASVLVTKGRY